MGGFDDAVDDADMATPGLAVVCVLAAIGALALIVALQPNQPAQLEPSRRLFVGCYVARGFPPILIGQDLAQLVGVTQPASWSIPRANNRSLLLLPFRLAHSDDAWQLTSDPDPQQFFTAAHYIGRRTFYLVPANERAAEISLDGRTGEHSVRVRFRRRPDAECGPLQQPAE
jgi:hypothetical protein